MTFENNRQSWGTHSGGLSGHRKTAGGVRGPPLPVQGQEPSLRAVRCRMHLSWPTPLSQCEGKTAEPSGLTAGGPRGPVCLGTPFSCPLWDTVSKAPPTLTRSEPLRGWPWASSVTPPPPHQSASEHVGPVISVDSGWCLPVPPRRPPLPVFLPVLYHFLELSLDGNRPPLSSSLPATQRLPSGWCVLGDSSLSSSWKRLFSRVPSAFSCARVFETSHLVFHT